MTVIAIIPARGGSKRIPRKNIRDICGRPMIAWPITMLLRSGLAARVVVTTDDREIAEIASAAGAEVPGLRDATLSDDITPTLPVIQDSIRSLSLPGESIVTCVYPTAPLLQAVDLARGIDLLKRTDPEFVFAAKRLTEPIFRAFTRSDAGTASMLFPEHAGTRTQDLDDTFVDAGQFYVARAGNWLAASSIISPHAAFIELPADRSIDIDTEDDLRRAERLKATLLGEHGDSG